MKLALVAMSGVRIVNPKLRNLGMTLPGFIERGKVIASLPSLGLLTVAAFTPEEWECSYFEIDELADQADVLCDFDLVAVSSLTARIEDAYRLSNELRNRGTKVIIGGLHATVLPLEAKEHADAVVVGEGESVWQEVLGDFPGFEQGVYRAVPHRFRPEQPVPRFDLLDFQKYNRIPLQTTRGCPLDCEFCAASRLLSSYKRKPIRQIEQELAMICGLWERPFIELADDNTFLHEEWSLDLLTVMEASSSRWFTETDISVASKPRILKRLAKSGCAQVLIGLESAIPESLVGLDRRDWKAKQLLHYREKIDLIQQAGVSVNGCFVLGLDGDGPDVFDSTLDFVQSLDLSEVQLTLMTPFPGTRLYERLSQEGRLLKERFWDQCTLFDVTFRPKNMTKQQLEAGFQNLVAQMYSEDATAQRKARFISAIRRGL